MKKCLCLLLVGVLAFSLAACQHDQSADTPSNVTNTIPQASPSDTTGGTETAQNDRHNTDENISSLSLNEAYDYAVNQHVANSYHHRNIGELQLETQQIIEIDNKYYQSYVASNVDIRYIWISQPEFPDERNSLWDWYAVGSAQTYTLDLLGKIDEGRR